MKSSGWLVAQGTQGVTLQYGEGPGAPPPTTGLMRIYHHSPGTNVAANIQDHPRRRDIALF